MSRYLYRGYGGLASDAIAQALAPKAPGNFSHTFLHDGSLLFDGSGTYGESERNAILRHQLNQDGLPTAGISTTPHKARAVFYALGGGRHKEGVVLAIDRLLLSRFGVSEHMVSSTVLSPAVPEDEEIILVHKSGGSLPLQIVVATERVIG